MTNCPQNEEQPRKGQRRGSPNQIYKSWGSSDWRSPGRKISRTVKKSERTANFKSIQIYKPEDALIEDHHLQERSVEWTERNLIDDHLKNKQYIGQAVQEKWELQVEEGLQVWEHSDWRSTESMITQEVIYFIYAR